MAARGVGGGIYVETGNVTVHGDLSSVDAHYRRGHGTGGRAATAVSPLKAAPAAGGRGGDGGAPLGGGIYTGSGDVSIATSSSVNSNTAQAGDAQRSSRRQRWSAGNGGTGRQWR